MDKLRDPQNLLGDTGSFYCLSKDNFRRDRKSQGITQFEIMRILRIGWESMYLLDHGMYKKYGNFTRLCVFEHQVVFYYGEWPNCKITVIPYEKEPDL